MQKNTDTRSVKSTFPRIYLLLLPVLLTVVLDEWIKSQALLQLPEESTILNPGLLEFAIHRNFGLAFDIPFRMEFVILSSLFIGFFLARIAYKNWLKLPYVTFASLMIIIGALGNLFDRVTYGFTVDYMLFLGRSAINFSDLVIMLGVLTLLLSTTKRKH